MRNNAHGQLKGALKSAGLIRQFLYYGVSNAFHKQHKSPTQRSITAVANQKGIDFYELRTVHPTT